MTPAEVEALLSGPIVVEEKLDGANLGFSLGPNGSLRAQNRGSYLHQPFSGQFKKLPAWTLLHEQTFTEALGDHLIAFGEWCAARHSLNYDRLPDWWLLFDVYDRSEKRFWSTRRRDEWAARTGVAVVHIIHQSQRNLGGLQNWIACQESAYRTGAIEGVVVRKEDEDWLVGRGKLVNPQFTQAIDEHWRRRTIEWNRIATPLHRA